MAETTFVAVVNLKDVGTHSTFPEAFVDFFHAVRASVKEGTTAQVLETACFIEQRFDGKLVRAWDFMSAKERAFVLGILTEDGKLVEAEGEGKS